MIIKVSSKHQVTIPSAIAKAFDLKKGDVLEIEHKGNKIIMTPKEVILEDKYLKVDIEGAEKVLAKRLPKEEIVFNSKSEMLSHFKKRIKK